MDFELIDDAILSDLLSDERGDFARQRVDRKRANRSGQKRVSRLSVRERAKTEREAVALRGRRARGGPRASRRERPRVGAREQRTAGRQCVGGRGAGRIVDE